MKIVKYLLASLPLVSAVVVIAITLDLGGLKYPPKKAVAITPSQPKHLSEQELWTLIGDYKEASSLQRPTKDQTLCEIAKMRLGVVAEDWSHSGFAEDWKFHMTPYSRMFENLARGLPDARSMMAGWINSPSHKEILDGNHPYACVECANINQTNYCVYISAI